ncbi:glycosyltransferase [Neolewinella aurantiaca]|uniref:Glycosyltransferase n=1 Tax=Neolewinella aurantiaca TaxID=2602767 RepID=A0A5C7FT96_9BACT|nr:glycosyltransferase [Neolewinella aurantiaca]TXF89695.1 glycosyltransferase [Neolewinella aurantiaca]
MEVTRPQVSIVIPAYNAQKFLARSVASVLSQKGCSFEIIIVENNSTDATLRVATALQDAHPGVVRVVQEKIAGASAARNAGLALARAEWIQFLDADDALLPGKLARQLQLTAPDTDWVIGELLIRWEDGEETVVPIADDPWQGLLFYAGLGHLNANLFRRSLADEIGGFNPGYRSCNDFEFFFRLLQRGANIVKDHLCAAVHFQHSGERITTTNLKEMARLRVALTKREVKHLKARRAQYYEANRETINAALLGALRKQATVDLPGAKHNFNEVFPEGYDASDFDRAFVPKHGVLYPFLGFGATECLRRFFSSFVPLGWRKFLK